MIKAIINDEKYKEDIDLFEDDLEEAILKLQDILELRKNEENL